MLMHCDVGLPATRLIRIELGTTCVCAPVLDRWWLQCALHGPCKVSNVGAPHPDTIGERPRWHHHRADSAWIPTQLVTRAAAPTAGSEQAGGL